LAFLRELPSDPLGAEVAKTALLKEELQVYSEIVLVMLA